MRNNTCLAAAVALVAIAGIACGLWSDPEEVTFYPTYGYEQKGEWIVPLRIWVHEPRAKRQQLLEEVVARFEDLNAEQRERLRSRLPAFLADDEAGEVVRIRFDHDPDRTVRGLRDATGEELETDGNGLITLDFRMSADEAEELTRARREAVPGWDGWLTYHAASEDHTGQGRILLVEDRGLSVISDVDDTVKVTEILQGAKVVVANTFFHPFRAAPGMVERYRQLAENRDAVFHYVSGGPWQLYRFLDESFEQARLPRGTFHMKNVRKNLATAAAWEDLKELAGGGATQEQKLEAIRAIFEHFPDRTFLLVGDSGEHDPEIYRQILEDPDLGPRVEEVWIRDVKGDADRNDRLAGMRVIDPETGAWRSSP